MKTIELNTQQTMTSLEIAELTGKQHKHVMEAIRKMEPAWVKTCGSNFRLTSRTIVQPNGGTREVPCYQLTKTECLYIATKFNDEARAKLVLRWEELERADASHGARHAVTQVPDHVLPCTVDNGILHLLLLHFIVGPHLVRAFDVLGIGNGSKQCQCYDY